MDKSNLTPLYTLNRIIVDDILVGQIAFEVLTKHTQNWPVLVSFNSDKLEITTEVLEKIPAGIELNWRNSIAHFVEGVFATYKHLIK